MPTLLDPGEYLSAELQRLDVLLHREILRLRATYQLSLDEFRGLYISDDQVDQFIAQALNREDVTSATEELTERAEVLRAAYADQRNDELPFSRLAAEFALSPTEQDILLLAVAPDINLKYETLYAYLNNDVTRKWPSRDLALRVFSTGAEHKMNVYRCLLPESVLFESGLLQSVSSTPERAPWRAGGFSVAPTVLHYLSGSPGLDPRLTSIVEQRSPSLKWEQLPLPSDRRAALRRLVDLRAASSPNGSTPLMILTGRDGAGRESAAEAVCHELGLSMLHVDLEALLLSAEDAGKLTQAILLQQRLQGAGLYLARGEALLDKEGQPLREAHRLIRSLLQSNPPVFLACPPDTRWREVLTGQRVVPFHFDDPDYATRLQLWKTALTHINAGLTQPELEALADRFALTPGQIASIITAAVDAHALSDEQSSAPLSSASLFAAARAQSDQSLGNLALKVRTIHVWEDLILPRQTLRRVKEVAAAIKSRHIVYTEWGFGQRIASGTGLKTLFTGSSGTGKTMTAGVIAGELGLDLYKIDLSGIVSKYIGETEKNLDRIFRAAQSSNAILFFDEADALFGKRSEVKDAHDRYANIEVSYLLQKLEEHEGVVILASNLSGNIDEAFSRRMHYVVEFPLPNEVHREQLWRGMFPPQVPLGEDVDLQFLARQFSLAGGDIRNVALNAAFLAAQDGQVITMRQLVQAMSRQMMKQGKIASPTDFKQYYALISQGE